jgi:cytochrome c oxidase subunit 2
MTAPGHTPRMRNRGLFIAGAVLLGIGVIGLMAATLSSGPGSGVSFASMGQRIYYTGSDANGPIPRATAGGSMGFGMMADTACVGCHGQDGRGGRVGMMFGSIDIPDIRYSTLTTSRTEEGTSTPAWSDRDITRAIRDGVEPNGQRLKAPMPRWAMTDADLADVITYLKELSDR